jgi:hypothetical protein
MAASESEFSISSSSKSPSPGGVSAPSPSSPLARSGTPLNGSSSTTRKGRWRRKIARPSRIAHWPASPMRSYSSSAPPKSAATSPMNRSTRLCARRRSIPSRSRTVLAMFSEMGVNVVETEEGQRRGGRSRARRPRNRPRARAASWSRSSRRSRPSPRPRNRPRAPTAYAGPDAKAMPSPGRRPADRDGARGAGSFGLPRAGADAGAAGRARGRDQRLDLAYQATTGSSIIVMKVFCRSAQPSAPLPASPCNTWTPRTC